MGMYDFSCEASVSVLSQNDTSCTYRVYCYWRNNAWTYSMSPVYAWVTFNGEERQVRWGDAINTKSDQYGRFEMGYADFTLSRGHDSWYANYSARLRSDSTYVSGERWSSSGSTVVARRPSYTVSYNANNGSGAPGSQTKWHDETLYLSSTRPTRTGYNFSKWTTASGGGGTSYNPGGAYTANAGATLYAQWTAVTYTVSYNANGGSGAPSSQTKTYGQTLTLSSTRPTRSGYNFKGWATSSTGSVVYQPGGSYTSNSAITLYAVWEVGYVAPRITGFTAYRCNSSGTQSDTGTYIRFDFSWNTDLAVKSVTLQYRLSTGTTWTGQVVSAQSGTGGKIVNQRMGGSLSIDSSYYARATVSDEKGDTVSSEVLIGTQSFPIDVKAQGKGVAFGKVAETNDLFDVNFAARFRKAVTLDAHIIGSSGLTFNRASTKPTMGLINQVIDTSGNYHGAIIGSNSSGTRYYGIDFKDSTSSPEMRLYAGDNYLSIQNSGGVFYNGTKLGVKPERYYFSGTMNTTHDTNMYVKATIPSSGTYLLEFSYMINQGGYVHNVVSITVGNHYVSYDLRDTWSFGATASDVLSLSAGNQTVATVLCWNAGQSMSWRLTATRLGEMQ